MTVEVYKPVLRSKTGQSAGRSFTRARTVVNRVETPLREIRHVYRPMQPRLDLVLGIEAMTHPDRPSFAELEAMISADLS